MRSSHCHKRHACSVGMPEMCRECHRTRSGVVEVLDASAERHKKFLFPWILILAVVGRVILSCLRSLGLGVMEILVWDGWVAVSLVETRLSMADVYEVR